MISVNDNNMPESTLLYIQLWVYLFLLHLPVQAQCLATLAQQPKGLYADVKYGLHEPRRVLD
jgi:hypothetical protein